MNFVKDKAFVLSTVLLFIAMSFNLGILPYFIALYVTLSIFTNFNGIKSKIKLIDLSKSIFIFFLVNLISLFYSDNIDYGFKIIETQLSILLIPLSVMPYSNQTYRHNRILKFYSLIILISVLYSTVYFIAKGYLQLTINNSHNFRRMLDFFNYYKLSVLNHATYYSMFIIWGIVIIVKLFKPKKVIDIILFSIIISTLLIFTVLIGSRAALLTILFLLFYYSLKILSKYNLIVKLISGVLLFTFIYIFIKNTRFNSNIRAIKLLSSIEEVDIRFSLWKDALYTWGEKPFFGHGIGDAKDQLVLVHKERNIEEALLREYNCHNQFLETATQTGLVGLTVLLLVFAIPLYQSIKKKQELLFLFLMICFINFLFESMLERLAGVVFFSFWYSFLWFVYYKKENS